MNSKLLSHQTVRYVLVALLNVVANYLFFSGFIFFHVHYFWASLSATVLSILFNFKTFSHLVFDTRNNWLIIKYSIVWAIVYLFSLCGLVLFNWFQVSNYVAWLILLFPSAGLGYLLNTRWVFKKDQIKL